VIVGRTGDSKPSAACPRREAQGTSGMASASRPATLGAPSALPAAACCGWMSGIDQSSRAHAIGFQSIFAESRIANSSSM